MKTLLRLAALLALPAFAAAAPMGFSGSQLVSGDFSPEWRELSANHAFTASDAVGVSVLSARSREAVDLPSGSHRLTRDAVQLTYTRLLRRWNIANAQANAWFIGGIGAVRGNDFDDTRTLYSPGLQLDYETTRVYLAATGRLYRAQGVKQDHGALKGGFSLYEVEYERTQPWLMLEVRRMRGMSHGTEVTPLVRLINKGLVLEAGVSTRGSPRFNFLYIF